MNLKLLFPQITNHFRPNARCMPFQIRRFSKLYEPDYIENLQYMTPIYHTTNIQIKGYDYALLESFQSLIDKIARTLELEVEDAWAQQAQSLKINRFKPNSTAIDSEYLLKLYERNVQVIDIKSHLLPILIEAVVTSCPAGVTVNVIPHNKDIELKRYIPDLELKQLKDDLTEMGGPSKKKN